MERGPWDSPRLRRAELGTLNSELGTQKSAAPAACARLRTFRVQSSKFRVKSSACRRRLTLPGNRESGVCHHSLRDLIPRSDTFATKLLFVCSQNRLRSLTAEKLFGEIPGFEVRSAGTQPDARIVVTEGHVRWADIIFVMEKSHLNRMRRKLGDALDGKRIITLHIPDLYDFMQPELIEELEAKVGAHIALPQA